jgi:hypothetical protein
MFHHIDLNSLAAVCGGNGVNTEETDANGTQASMKRSNMGTCLANVSNRCENSKANTWFFGMFRDRQKIAQCKVENAPVQCFDDPPQ